MSVFWMCLITLAMLQMSVFCTTIYLHRAMTHKGLSLHPVVKFLMHLELTLFTGIVPREWVAVHRKHHYYSDQEGDPHSPLLEGMWKVLFGNFFMYRKAKSDTSMVKRFTPDWQPDLIDHIPGNRYGVLGGLVIFCLMFGWGWGFAAWLMHAILYILLNSAINSLGHAVGYRTYKNKATNLKWLALLTAGEGLHNNHQERPTSPNFLAQHDEIDPGWALIRLLRFLKLARIETEVRV